MGKKLSTVDRVLGSWAREKLPDGYKRVTEVRRAYYAGLSEGSGAVGLAVIQRKEVENQSRRDAEIAQKTLCEQRIAETLKELRGG